MSRSPKSPGFFGRGSPKSHGSTMRKSLAKVSSMSPKGSTSPSLSSLSSRKQPAFQINQPRNRSKENLELQITRHYFSKMEDSLDTDVFSLEETLGTGTFGRVRLVNIEMESETQYFALKIMKKREIVRLKQIAHVRAERSILSKMMHPFIVNLFAAFQDDYCCYMLLEYVIGGELFSQLRKVGRFNNDTATFYAAEIALAFEHLHKHDIIYRDLKPENLLLDGEGHIKITDFGFAKEVEDRTWTLCGTPEYLAPEIVQSRGHGKAVDWWALGILIYEMLAGYTPFYDSNTLTCYQLILAGDLQFPRHFHQSAKDIVMGFLRPDRTLRLGCLQGGAEDVLQHAWFRGIDWQLVYERRVEAPYRPPVSGPGDTSNFDSYPDSPPTNEKAMTDYDDQFADF